MKLRWWHLALIAMTVIIGALAITARQIMASGGKLVQVTISDREVIEFREFAFNYRKVFFHRTPNPAPKPSDGMAKELEAEGFGPLLKLFRQDPDAVWNLHYSLNTSGPSITIQGSVSCDPAAMSSLAVKAAKPPAKVHVNKDGHQLRGETKAGGRQFSFYLFTRGGRQAGQYSLYFQLWPKPGTPRQSAADLKHIVPPSPGIASGSYRP